MFPSLKDGWSFTIGIDGPQGYLQVGDTGQHRKARFRSEAALPRGRFTISASPERCPLSLNACLSQTACNLYPCARRLTRRPPADLTTIRGFTTQGCLKGPAGACCFVALRFVSLRRSRSGRPAEPGPWCCILRMASRFDLSKLCAPLLVKSRKERGGDTLLRDIDPV